MNIVWLKVIVLISMIIITFFAGILPVRVLKLLRKRAASASTLAKHRIASLVLCLLTCFSGGVFFATCFLHLFPELTEHVNHMKELYGFSVSYPLAELLSCTGFFLLFFMEELILFMLPGIGHSHGQSSTAIAESFCGKTVTLAEPEACERNCETVNEDPPILMQSRPHAHSHGVRSITFVLAISFHSIIEGLALGVQNDPTQVGTLFLSLMVHKVIVAFSVGLQLGRTHAHASGWVMASVLLLSTMSPLGGFIGMFVQNSQLDTEVKDITVMVFQGLAVGTFIYVTFFEVLIHERDNEHPNLLKVLSMLVGFAMIGSIRLLDNHTHEYHSRNGSHTAHFTAETP